MTDPQPLQRGTFTFLFSDIEGSTTPGRALGTRPVRRSPERHRGASFARPDRWPTAAANRAPRATPSSSSSTSALAGRHRGRRRPARSGGGALAGRAPRSASGWASTPARPTRPAGPSRARHQPGRADRGGRPTAARSWCRMRPATLVAAELGDGVSLRGLGEHRLKDLREPEPLCPGRGRRPARRSSRRCARSTPGRTTCRPS